MRWIFASEVCSRISLIFFCTWIYTCKTLNFLKFTVPPSSTDIQLIYNVSVRQDVQWKKGYWLVLKFHKETYIIVSCTVDVIFTHVIGMKRSPYIYFFKTWAKFNADIFVRVHLLVFKMQGTRNISTSVLVRHRLPFWIITVCRYVIWDWSYLIHIM